MAQAAPLPGLIQLGKAQFEVGYWQGMRQPAFLIPMRLTRAQVNASALQHFDDLRKALFQSPMEQYTLPKEVMAHPILGRVIGLSLDMLSHMGMPVMGGAKVLQAARPVHTWWLGLAAVHAENQSPVTCMELACLLMNDVTNHVRVELPKWGAHFNKMQQKYRHMAPSGVNTLRFLQEADQLNIPWRHMFNNVYQFGWGRHSRWLDSSFTDQTSVISASLARDKIACAKVLRDAGLPVPRHQLVHSPQQAISVAKALGFPVVVKPANLDGGKGVRAGMQDENEVTNAYEAVAKLSERVLVEQFIEGNDYRIRVCQGEVISIVIRIPASVTGDGVSTLQTLIDETNQSRAKASLTMDPGIEQGVNPIVVDEEVTQWLHRQNWTWESIVPAGQRVRLRGAANVSLGGTTWDVTAQAHPDNMALALQAASALRLDLAGVDLIIPDISQSWRNTSCAICEVNAQPQYSTGTSHRQVLSRLLPGQGRVPMVALSGWRNPPDLARLVVQPLREHGLRIALTDQVQTCRRALQDNQVDGVIFIASQAPAPGTAAAFDRASLILQATDPELAPGPTSPWPHEARWLLEQEPDWPQVCQRLVGYLRSAIRP
jgi:D-alanine-D-alanine ligase-like ATP-grasp enzyme